MDDAGHVRPEPAAYALAYREARRALDEQSQVLNELRSRAGTLFAAAAVTTSFLGGHILDAGHMHPLAWVAVGLFVVVGVSLIVLLIPWHDWTFTISVGSFIGTYLENEDEPPFRLSEIHRDLALHMQAAWRRNRIQLRWLQVVFRGAAGVLVIEVVLWVIALRSHG